ncbi:MAG: hypothetical protein RL110_982 [Bacteroidota bacterium]|jgi:glucose-1-phosphate cytidylyltransferase
MKTIILAGGLGTRLSEETEDKPKPMVLIGEKPILWHLLNIYSSQGFQDFVLALGYRGDVIKRWLKDLFALEGDLKFDFTRQEVDFHNKDLQPWVVRTFDTGIRTQTGGRIAKCMRNFPGERFLATYGDGLANIDLKQLIDFHESHGKKATVTAVRPPARFGQLQFQSSGEVSHFGEKFQADAGWINGGFFVLEPEVEAYVYGDDEPFETGALPRLVKENQLMAFQHDGFWQPMDTLREKKELEQLAKLNPPPWVLS